jgi:hypothetical protein
MAPDDKPMIVSLETHRRRRVEETRKAKAAARKMRKTGVQGERAINWRRAPLALLALAFLMLAMWLVGRLTG